VSLVSLAGNDIVEANMQMQAFYERLLNVLSSQMMCIEDDFLAVRTYYTSWIDVIDVM
jgi:hypothetical protein